MINHLYIVGNGFDLHHEIPSTYKNFREWLNGYQNAAGNYPFKAIVMRLDDIYGLVEQSWKIRFPSLYRRIEGETISEYCKRRFPRSG